MSHHEARTRDLLSRISRQFSSDQSGGHSQCPSAGCSRTARAGDHCFYCLTDKLGACCGEADALIYLRAAQNEHEKRCGLILSAAAKDNGHE